MSGIVSSISNAIESATYNPELAKKKEEEQRKLKAAVDAYKKDLEGYKKELDTPVKLPGSGPGPAPRSEYYVKKLTDLLDTEKKYVDGEPSSIEEVEKRQEETKEKMEDIRKANQAAVRLSWYPAMVDGVQKDFKAKGIQIPKDDLDRFKEVKSKSETFLRSILNEDPRRVIETQKEIDNIWTKNKTNVPVVQSEEDVKKLTKNAEEAEKAEAATFSFRRMIGTITSTAATTVFVLFLVMLFLVGGMLASNAAIGRPYLYRILYFFYGGLFSPFVILYYLYQWFFGTSLKIYTLLPIFTQVSDTSLGRFLFFPFTYTPDQNEETQRMEYLKKAAAIVGGGVKAQSQLESFTVGLENLKLPSPEKLETLVKELEKVQLPQAGNLTGNIVQKLEAIRLEAPPRPSAPLPNIVQKLEAIRLEAPPRPSAPPNES